MNEEPFVAPRNFAEYIERYSDYHRKWLSRNHRMLGRDTPDYEDAAQFLLLETLRKNRVEMYNSAKRRGKEQRDTPGLFLHFMGTCFANDMRTRYRANHTGKRRMNEGTVSLGEFISIPEQNKNNFKNNDDEWLPLVSEVYAGRAVRQGEAILVASQLAQFRAYVAEHRPHLLQALDDVQAAPVESRRKLRELAQHMADGSWPGRKRKEYRRRERASHAKHRQTPAQLLSAADRRLSGTEASAELGLPRSSLQYLVNCYFGTTWRGLVRLRQQEKATHA